MVNTQLEHRFGIAGMGVVFLVSSIPIMLGALLIYKSIVHEFPLIIGVFLLSLGVLGCTIREGIIINPAESWYKYYFSVLSMKFGKRKSLNSYKDILCLRYKTKFQLYTEYQGLKETYGGIRHEIYLASPNHLNMILIKTADSTLDGEEKAHELGQKLGMEWVQYNPGCRRPRKVLGGMKVSTKKMKI